MLVILVDDVDDLWLIAVDEMMGFIVTLLLYINAEFDTRDDNSSSLSKKMQNTIMYNHRLISPRTRTHTHTHMHSSHHCIYYIQHTRDSNDHNSTHKVFSRVAH